MPKEENIMPTDGKTNNFQGPLLQSEIPSVPHLTQYKRSGYFWRTHPTSASQNVFYTGNVIRNREQKV